MSEQIDVEGTVCGVFAHRFAIDTPTGKILADLGPKAGSRIVLREGDGVRISGDRKPSEIKVALLVTADGETHRIDHEKKHDHPEADPEIALAAVCAEGFAVTREPKRKPKHWEVAATRDGRPYELHVELDGKIRKRKDLAA